MFGSTGLAVLRALNIATLRPTRNVLAPWLLAPAIGMGTFGPFSLLFLRYSGFSGGTILLAWGVFIGAIFCLVRYRPQLTPENIAIPAGIPSLANGKVLILLLGAGIWAILPTIHVYPIIHSGGIYVANMVADHVKIAMLDGIAREGLPLKNPFYAPRGERILLSYSYGWYVMGAEIKLLSHANGWEAEIGLMWYTCFACMTFLCAIASGLSGRFRAGIAVLLLAATGPLARDLLPYYLGRKWEIVYGLPSGHGLELPWIQFAWAPQHAFAALEVVVLLWLVSAVLASAEFQVWYVAVVSLVAAAAFEASTWVGCVAVLAVFPFVLGVVALLRLPKRNYLNALKTFLPAAILCAAIAFPIIAGLFSGPRGFHSENRPVGFGVFPTTYLELFLDFHGVWATLARIVLFWVHLLPLSFGVIFILGALAILDWRPANVSEKIFHALALTAAAGFLLVTQFIKSTISANDLGWRAVNPPLLILIIWAAVAFAHLTARGHESFPRWRTRARTIIANRMSLAFVTLLLILGLLSTARVIFTQFAFPKTYLAERRLFTRQAEAWDVVRRYTKPGDLVQSNPEGFPDVTPWPINLPPHLLADRPMAYACTGTGETYAFRYPLRENHRQFRQVQAIFTADADRTAIRIAHDTLLIKAILITRDDPAWSSDAIEKSSFYRRVARTDSYKVYIAKKGPDRSTIQ